MLTSIRVPLLRLLPRRPAHAALAAGASCVLGMTLLASLPSSAAQLPADGPVFTTTVTDADDTDGPIDMARVRHRIRVIDRHHARISYTVKTVSPFSVGRLDSWQRNFVIELNRDGHPGSERNVRISYLSDGLAAELISNATREVITRVGVQRVDARTIRVFGWRHQLGARTYFWTSTFHSRGSSTACGIRDGYPVTCQDVVPDRGWVRMDRPAWPAAH